MIPKFKDRPPIYDLWGLSKIQFQPFFVSEKDRRHLVVLDLGCGDGHTLYSTKFASDVIRIGLDIDWHFLNSQKHYKSKVSFVNGCGEKLPFRNGQFDLVYSQVSLPYMHIPTALKETLRILKKGGIAFFILHSYIKNINLLIGHLNKFQIKGIAYQSFAILNSILLHLTGRQLRYPSDKFPYESFQTMSGMSRLLKNIGFKDIKLSQDKRFFAIAKK